MNEAISPAIELFVGLLLLAVVVAIAVRPLRLPYTVALVVAGLLVGIGANAAGAPTIDVPPELVLLVLLPGLVFEAAYRMRVAQLRRWFGALPENSATGLTIMVQNANPTGLAQSQSGKPAPHIERQRRATRRSVCGCDADET